MQECHLKGVVLRKKYSCQRKRYDFCTPLETRASYAFSCWMSYRSSLHHCKRMSGNHPTCSQWAVGRLCDFCDFKSQYSCFKQVYSSLGCWSYQAKSTVTRCRKNSLTPSQFWRLSCRAALQHGVTLAAGTKLPAPLDEKLTYGV